MLMPIKQYLLSMMTQKIKMTKHYVINFFCAFVIWKKEKPRAELTNSELLYYTSTNTTHGL